MKTMHLIVTLIGLITAELWAFQKMLPYEYREFFVHAVSQRDLATVKSLLAHKVDANQHDDNGRTALMLAIDNLPMVELLLTHKATIEPKSYPVVINRTMFDSHLQYKTALDQACLNYKKPDSFIIIALLFAHPSMTPQIIVDAITTDNFEDYSKRTAIRSGSPETTLILRAARAFTYLVDKENRKNALLQHTPLSSNIAHLIAQYAALYHHIEGNPLFANDEFNTSVDRFENGTIISATSTSTSPDVGLKTITIDTFVVQIRDGLARAEKIYFSSAKSLE